MPFYAGTDALGYGSLLIVPRQAAFFAAALADLQGMIPRSQVPGRFQDHGRRTVCCAAVSPHAL